MADDSRVSTLPMTAAYFRLIVRRFGATPAWRAALLDGPEPTADADITVGTQLQQLAQLHAFAPPDWGLQLGAALDGVTHGPAAAVAVTAPTLGAAIEALARYAPVRTPFIDLRGVRAGPGHELRILEPCALGAVRTAVLEMVLLSTQGVLEAAFVRAAHRRGLLPHADRAAHRDACARLEALRQRLAGDFVDALVERLLDGGDDAGPTLAETARRLHLSPRTLVRRLGARGTTFRALLEGHHRRRATLLLRQPQLTVAEIAERLGYQDATNFGRACRRWFGLSPRAWRGYSRGGLRPPLPRG